VLVVGAELKKDEKKEKKEKKKKKKTKKNGSFSLIERVWASKLEKNLWSRQQS
jgi:hypothetical protein